MKRARKSRSQGKWGKKGVVAVGPFHIIKKTYTGRRYRQGRVKVKRYLPYRKWVRGY